MLLGVRDVVDVYFDDVEREVTPTLLPGPGSRSIGQLVAVERVATLEEEFGSLVVKPDLRDDRS